MTQLPRLPSPWTPEQVLWIKRIALAIFALLVIFFLWQVRSILPLFLIGFFIAYLLDPLVDRLEERGFSRTSGTVVVFSVFFLAALGLALVLVPPLIDQVTSLVSACLPPKGRYYLLALQLLDFVEVKILKGEIPAFLEQGFQRVLEQLGNFLLAKLQGAISTLTGLFSLIVLPFIVFFALQIVDPLRERIKWWVPAEYREPLSGLVKEVGQLVGRYVRGYIVLCFAVGVAETIFLLICRWIFGMDYVLAVGIFGGATYAIPYFGALLTTLIGGLVAYTTAHQHQILCAVIVALGLAIINQAFDWLIMPRVVGRQVGLHPLTVLFAVMAGGTMLGILGMLLAVPIAGAVKLTLQTIFPQHFAPMTEEANAVKMTAGDYEKRGEGQ
ncbi:MAG: AI-2E family transporter [Armatimonadetes bacterium]|nr:AI-2E family transporter [Armatimonadota bacterium]MCX7966992.1 AI-2E family transporter [Armatimonadota bacterium]MDW8142149.1 AI-2E family transporter [Armatimonadota bacterium]